jgi:hypothetical protein
MKTGPIANLKSKQRAKKEKPKEPSLRARAMHALDADFKLHGENAIKQLRETRPDRYVELAARPTDLPTEGGFEQCRDMRDIGVKLLQSIGFTDPDEDSIAAAIAANDQFIATLQQIHHCAQASEEEIH